MDDEFGHENYLATVIWQRTTAKSLARRTMGAMHEQILVYGASEAAELTSIFPAIGGELPGQQVLAQGLERVLTIPAT